MRKRMIFVLAILSAVSLTGCATSSQSSDPPAQRTDSPQAQEASSQPVVTGGPGTYALQLAGVSVSVEVPAPESDEELREIEAYRKKLGVSSASYMKITIDNTAGTEAFSLNSAKAVSSDGQQIELKPGRQALGEWIDEWAVDQDLNGNSLYEKGLKMLNARVEQTDVLPGAKSSFVLVSGLESSGVKSIWVNNEQTSFVSQ